MKKIFTVQYRRAREAKTDYDLRLKLLKSGKERLVVRKSDRNLLAQVVQYTPTGDKITSSASSRDLVKLGWKGSRKSIPAGYLVGLLIGKKAKGKNVIVDLGFQVSNKGSKLYAIVQGAIEGGAKVECDKSMFPDPKRYAGEEFLTIKKKIGAQ